MRSFLRASDDRQQVDMGDSMIWCEKHHCDSKDCIPGHSTGELPTLFSPSDWVMWNDSGPFQICGVHLDSGQNRWNYTLRGVPYSVYQEVLTKSNIIPKGGTQ